MLKVDCVAIRDDYGRVWSLPRPARHHTVIIDMHNKGFNGRLSGDRQGFLLTDGSFATRARAKEIATEAGQLINGKTISNILTSEDLW